jgi:hypothetical protein
MRKQACKNTTPAAKTSKRKKAWHQNMNFSVAIGFLSCLDWLLRREGRGCIAQSILDGNITILVVSDPKGQRKYTDDDT